jgi:hypothetical protein
VEVAACGFMTLMFMINQTQKGDKKQKGSVGIPFCMGDSEI